MTGFPLVFLSLGGDIRFGRCLVRGRPSIILVVSSFWFIVVVSMVPGFGFADAIVDDVEFVLIVRQGRFGGMSTSQVCQLSIRRGWLKLGTFVEFLAGELGETADGIAFIELDEANALSIAADCPYRINSGTDDHTCIRCEHNLIIVGHLGDCYNQPVALGRLDVD